MSTWVGEPLRRVLGTAEFCESDSSEWKHLVSYVRRDNPLNYQSTLLTKRKITVAVTRQSTARAATIIAGIVTASKHTTNKQGGLYCGAEKAEINSPKAQTVVETSIHAVNLSQRSKMKKSGSIPACIRKNFYMSENEAVA